MKKKYVPFVIILIILAIGSMYLVQNIYKTDNNPEIAKQAENINNQIENNDTNINQNKDNEQIDEEYIDNNETQDNKQIDKTDNDEQKEATLIYFSTAT